VLWEFALLSYLGVLLNLNPLMEFDGYYVLSDLLEKPNLRPRALAWLGRDLIPALRTSGGLKGHRLELFYGLASVLYVALMGVLTVVLYRLVVQGWMEGILPDVLAPVWPGCWPLRSWCWPRSVCWANCVARPNRAHVLGKKQQDPPRALGHRLLVRGLRAGF
jgi:hypothetical protein